MSFVMTQAEREAFLADLHVGIISMHVDGRGPLTVPIWYTYAPGGELHVITGSTSRKAALLRSAGRFSLCVQTETSPYQYVSVEGPIVAFDPVDRERDLRPMAQRYLGTEGGDLFVTQSADTADTDDLLVRMRPERWLAVDYGKSSAANDGD